MLERSPTVVRDGVAVISLGHGLVALVDEADLAVVAGKTWRAQQGKNTKYAVTGRHGLLHRAVMGEPSGMFVDHVNGDGLDNRRANLRVCNNAQNTQNQRKRVGLKSAYKGVSRTGNGAWAASIEKGGKKVHLGVYATEELAARQYDRAARLMFGKFAKTNAQLGLLA